MSGPGGDLPPELRAAFDLPGDARAQRLPGGRTNRVWRVEPAGQAVIVKALADGPHAPLFPNSYDTERAALERFGPQGLAPTLLASAPEHRALLTSFIPGASPASDAEPLARTLRTLHAGPVGDLGRRRPGTVAGVLAEGDRILATLATPGRAAPLRPLLDDMPLGPEGPLHGDPVPGNVVLGRPGAVLIDWQCAGRGPALEDISLALSPAMRLTNGCARLGAGEQAVFFATYGNRALESLYRAAAPAYHWRMVCHCQWRIEAGFPEFEAAFAAEAAALADCVSVRAV
ncbi:MAG: aminoglycoside phosphotransferase family protein [Pseudomonadota bacterium]